MEGDQTGWSPSKGHRLIIGEATLIVKSKMYKSCVGSSPTAAGQNGAPPIASKYAEPAVQQEQAQQEVRSEAQPPAKEALSKQVARTSVFEVRGSSLFAVLLFSRCQLWPAAQIRVLGSDGIFTRCRQSQESF